MKQPFKHLLGSRLVIENFLKETKESSIQLLDDTKKQMDEEKITSTQRFKILQVGSECSKEFKAGQEIYIESPERVLNPEVAETIIEDNEIVGFIIPERMVAAIF